MELTNAKALLAKIASDPETARLFAGVTSPEAFLTEAKKLGYTCTLEEFVAAKEEGLPADAEGAMSDEELAQTSGGLSMVGIDYAFTAAQTASK